MMNFFSLLNTPSAKSTGMKINYENFSGMVSLRRVLDPASAALDLNGELRAVS